MYIFIDTAGCRNIPENFKKLKANKNNLSIDTEKMREDNVGGLVSSYFKLLQ